jgi:hypothetical protein
MPLHLTAKLTVLPATITRAPSVRSMMHASVPLLLWVGVGESGGSGVGGALPEDDDDDELLLDVSPPPPACDAASAAHSVGVATPRIFIALSKLVATIVHCAVCLPADAHELVDLCCDVCTAVHAATAHAQSSARAVDDAIAKTHTTRTRIGILHA